MPDVFSEYISSWLPSKTSRFLSIFWEPICSRDADERREQGFNTGVAHLISTFGMALRKFGKEYMYTLFILGLGNFKLISGAKV